MLLDDFPILQEISQPWWMTPEGKLNVSLIYIYIPLYIIISEYIPIESPLNIIYPLVNYRNYGKSPFLMGKSTISMAIFNSFLLTFTRGYPIVSPWNCHCCWLNPKFSCDATTTRVFPRMSTERTECRHPGAQVSPWGGVKPGDWTIKPPQSRFGPPEFS